MKLEGIHISNLGTLRKHFKLEEVWANLRNGMLLECQRDLKKQDVYAAEEMMHILEAYEKKEGITELISGFFSGGRWDLNGLEQTLSSLCIGSTFYPKNAAGLKNLINRGKINWNEETAALFYIFLLLMLQARPKEEITDKEFAFIEEKLSSIAAKEKGRAVTKPAFGLYPYASGVLYLKEGKVVNQKNELLSVEGEKIACFAYTEELGLIAFTEQGELSAHTEANVRYEIEQRQNASNGKIIMAAAYGRIFLLLTEMGTVISNVVDSITEWKDIKWIGAGLNSITAVRGNNRHILELGSDDGLGAFSDVKAVYTRSTEGCHRYAVLKENGDLIMDDGAKEEGVLAAGIDKAGYLFAVGTEIFLREFETKRKRKYRVPQAEAVLEVCKCCGNLYYMAYAGGSEKLFSVGEEQFL